MASFLSEEVPGLFVLPSSVFFASVWVESSTLGTIGTEVGATGDTVSEGVTITPFSASFCTSVAVVTWFNNTSHWSGVGDGLSFSDFWGEESIGTIWVGSSSIFGRFCGASEDEAGSSSFIWICVCTSSSSTLSLFSVGFFWRSFDSLLESLYIHLILNQKASGKKENLSPSVRGTEGSLVVKIETDLLFAFWINEGLMCI